MKVPWMWLKDYVDLSWTPDQTADVLTAVGVNVENLSYEKLQISSVVSARILQVRPHPNRDNESIGILDTGNGTVQVVSGAPGFQEGNTTLLALPKANLPGNVSIETKEVGGIKSEGMVLSANELLTGQPPRPYEDIILLPTDTRSGALANELLQLDDWVFELELTVNYSHCLGILGVAIEAGAAAEVPLKLPRVLAEWNWAGPRGSMNPYLVEKSINSCEQDFSIELPRPDLCPRYVGKIVDNLRFTYSPVNLERRLYLAGQRPLNLVVDVGNYVMLETGQPLHTFDADKLTGKTITVRPAEEGDTLITIDDEKRVLPKGSIVIADEQGPVAVAGIMGGKATEITESTRRVFIESASFNPLEVRLASQRLRLRTEAALRFEKGIDQTAQVAVAERAADLLASLSGGRALAGCAETDTLKHEAKEIVLRMKTVERVLGRSFSTEECKALLETIHFQVTSGEQSVSVVVPPRRVDIQGEIDLVEEIARLHGFDKFEASYLSKAVLSNMDSSVSDFKDKLGSILVSLGGLESVTNSLIGTADLLNLGWDENDPRGNPVRIKNPLSMNESVLRTSLLPGLIKTASINQRNKTPGMFVWEMGRVFFSSQKAGELPLEAGQIAMMSYGTLSHGNWAFGSENAGFFQLKGALAALFDLLNVADVSYMPKAGMPFHPGRSAKMVANMSVIGEIGEVHPLCQKDLGLTQPVFMAWLSLDVLADLTGGFEFERVSKLMPVERDLAVVVPERVSGGDVVNAVKETGTDLVYVGLFDVWRKPPVPEGHKSLALRLVYQPKERALTEEELSADRERILSRLAKEFDAVLRI